MKSAYQAKKMPKQKEEVTDENVGDAVSRLLSHQNSMFEASKPHEVQMPAILGFMGDQREINLVLAGALQMFSRLATSQDEKIVELEATNVGLLQDVKQLTEKLQKVAYESSEMQKPRLFCCKDSDGHG